MDQLRRGEIALKVLKEMFKPGFSLDYSALSEKIEVPIEELIEVLEPLEMELRYEMHKNSNQ